MNLESSQSRAAEAARNYDRFCKDLTHACSSRCDYLVTIDLDGHLITEYLQYDPLDDMFVWENDWYEGESSAQLVGCVPVRDIRVFGAGAVEVWPNDEP